MDRKTLCVLLLAVVAGCSGKKGTSVGVCPGPVATSFDKDGDLLTDEQEAILGTDPTKADTDGDGFSDYVEVMAGTNPLDKTSHPSASQVASVHQITNASDLIGGEGAQGALGDWLLQNDKIRAIVERPDALQMQLGTYGGNLIDADVVRNAGDPGRDIVGMIIPLVSLGSTIHPDKIEVVKDGSDGGAVDVRVCGKNDIYQYLDLTATFQIVGGLSVNYDTNKIFPLEMSNDYILAPGSDSIEIVTTLANKGKKMRFPIGDVIDSGGAHEIYVTNSQGFGAQGFGALAQIQPPTRYIGFLGSAGAWGYVPDADQSVSVTISGVTVTAQDFPNIFSVLGSDPASTTTPPPPGMYDLPGGGRFSFHRAIRVTDGSKAVEPFAETYYTRHATATTKPSLHTGTVADSNGVPMAGVRIAALVADAGQTDDADPVTTTESDAAGNYELSLPDGNYYLLADKRGYGAADYGAAQTTTVNTLASLNTLTAASVTLGGASALPDITFPVPGTLAIAVTNTSGGPVPCRLIVVDEASSVPADDSIFRDPKEHDSTVIVANELSTDGHFNLSLPPGTYDVYVTHGIEWSEASELGVVVGAGTTNRSYQIARVVDTPGWISGDFHVHMLNSPDSEVPLRDRTLNGATDGLDVLVTTDHDFVTDLSPYVTSLGVGGVLATVPGEEVTTWDMGHFNVFPLMVQGTDLTNGAEYWAGDPAPDTVFTHRTEAQIFSDLDAKNPGTQVRQINHPRSPGLSDVSKGFRLQAFYDAIHLDTNTLQTKVDANFLRVPTQAGATTGDSKLFDTNFDAQEVMNAADAVGIDGKPTTIMTADMNDFFTLLDHGLQISPMGNSDTHKVFSNQLGYPRNYVKVPDDDPSHLSTGGNLENMALGVVNGQTFFTTGPFVKVTVTGATTGSLGDLVTPTAGGNVSVQVDVDMPEWVTVDTVRLYVNTPNTSVAATGASTDAYGNTTPPTAQYGSAGNLTLSTVTISGGFKHKTGTITFNVATPATGDQWVVAAVSAEGAGAAGTSLWPVIPTGSGASNGIRPYAFTSPVYVDGNKNGNWDPPGVITTLAYKPPPKAVVHPYKASDVGPEGTPDIREQFELLTGSSCDSRHDSFVKGNAK